MNRISGVLRRLTLCAICLLLSGVTIFAAARGALGCDFYPRFRMGGGGALAAAGYASYALLALAPGILEWEEGFRWRALRSKA